MELLGNLGLGLSVACAPINLLYALLGGLLGSLVGVLPGIGPVTAMAMLLPAAYALPPATALILLAAVYYGGQYGASTSAILLERSGPSPVVTGRDGSPMARLGRAGPALVAAGLGALVAGVVGTVVLAIGAPALARWVQPLGAPENLALMLLGLVGTVVLAPGRLLKGLAMALLGLLLGLVGTDASSGVVRFALDLPELHDGIGLVALAIGVFAYGDLIKRLARNAPAPQPTAMQVHGLWPTRLDYKDLLPALLRGTTLGTLLGLLPGGAALLAAFASYGVEKAVPAQPGEIALGQGNIRGVAAPEAAHSAAVHTAFTPLLALGIPGNAVMALLLGAMALHHIQAGPQALTEHPEVLWGLVASLWVGKLLMALLHVPLTGLWRRLLVVPYRWLFPAIVLLCVLGVYSVHQRMFDIWLLTGFGVLGYLFHLLELQPAPLLLGFILGPAMEENLRKALQLSGGDWSVFVTHPLSAGLLLVALCLLVLVLLPVVKTWREDAFVEDPN